MVKDMTVGRPLRAMLLFVVPVLMGHLLQQCYNAVDTLVVGRALGEASLGAVGSTGNLSNFILFFISGLTNGFAVVLGQRFGAKDEAGVRRSAAASVMLGAGFAVVLTIVSVLLARPMLRWMKTPDDLIGEAYDYMVVIFWGVGATLCYNLIANMLRALGDSRTPLIFLCVSSVMNILLDLLFVLTFGLGVRGAALATVAATLTSAVACAVYAWKKFPQLHFGRADCRAAVGMFWEHLRIALPMGLQMSVMDIGHIAMTAAVNRLGSTAVSAFAVATRVNAFAEVFQMAFGTTIAAYVAQNYGAKRIDRIRTGVRQNLLLLLGITLVVSTLMILFNRQFVLAFLNDPGEQTLYYATQFLYISAFFYPMLATLKIFRSSIQSMGNSLLPFIACILELGLRVGCAFYSISQGSYLGVCFASPLAWVGAAVFLTVSYIVVLKKKRAQMSPQAV